MSMVLKPFLVDQKILPNSVSNPLEKDLNTIIVMARIVVMAGGVVLNAAVFIGGIYLAGALSRGDTAALE